MSGIQRVCFQIGQIIFLPKFGCLAPIISTFKTRSAAVKRKMLIRSRVLSSMAMAPILLVLVASIMVFKFLDLASSGLPMRWKHSLISCVSKRITLLEITFLLVVMS